MPTDAKLGMVLGVVLVVVIAMVFFRKDIAPTSAQAAPVPAAGQTANPGAYDLPPPPPPAPAERPTGSDNLLPPPPAPGE